MKWCNNFFAIVEQGMTIPIDPATGDAAELVVAKVIKKTNHRIKMSWLKLLRESHFKVFNHTRKRFRRNYGKH